MSAIYLAYMFEYKSANNLLIKIMFYHVNLQIN